MLRVAQFFKVEGDTMLTGSMSLSFRRQRSWAGAIFGSSVVVKPWRGKHRPHYYRSVYPHLSGHHSIRAPSRLVFYGEWTRSTYE